MLATSIPRQQSFCTTAILGNDLLVVPDTAADERFAALQMVTSDPRIRFYTGAPLQTPDGFNIGTLAVMDRQPRNLSSDQAAAIWALSRQVMTRLELQRSVSELQISATTTLETTDALREAEAKFRSLVEALPAVVYFDEYSNTGTTIYMSPRIKDLLGYTAEEYAGDPELWMRILHPEDRDGAMDYQEATLASGNPWELEYRMIAQDGHIVWVHDKAVLVRDERGRPIGWQGVWMDITGRKQVEHELSEALEREQSAADRLRELDRLKNTLLHAVSHDLRSPITSMLGSAITLEREEENLSPKDRQMLVRGLASSARKMHRLVNDLLDMDRIDRGIVTPRRHPTDVGALVQRVVEELGFMTDRPLEVDVEQVVVAVDAPQVERIVENLLANTARHTPSGTQVWARAHRFEEGVEIVVEDNGRGVPRELWETIFEPFKQAGPRNENQPGVGIGLSLVARFTELHGGRAWVSDRDGGGASFHVYLPDGPPEPEELEAPTIIEAPPVPRSSKKD
jgi:PAS domain S-box-containing protein